MLGLAMGMTKASYKWTPKSVGAEIAMWLKNNVGVTVGQWIDSSGSNRHLRQANPDNQAAVVGGGLDFEGTDSGHYDIANDIVVGTEEALMIFMVCDIESYDSENSILGASGVGAFLEFQDPNKLAIKTSGGDTDTIQYAADTFAAGEKALFGIQRMDGGVGLIKVWKNGSLLTVASTPLGNDRNTGAITFNVVGMRNDDRFFDGKIYEMIVYKSKDLTVLEIGKINDYLTNKHGL